MLNLRRNEYDKIGVVRAVHPNGSFYTPQFIEIMWTVKGAEPYRICVAELWQNGSCALSGLHGWCYSWPTGCTARMLWEFLGTQPFKCVDSWEHKIFTILPGHLGGPAKEFAQMFGKPIATFPNLAHGGHNLTLHLLDLRDVPADNPNVS